MNTPCTSCGSKTVPLHVSGRCGNCGYDGGDRHKPCETIGTSQDCYKIPGVTIYRGDDGQEHYAMGHRVLVGSEIHTLCTKCCDRAKANGATVRNV